MLDTTNSSNHNNPQINVEEQVKYKKIFLTKI